MKKGEVWMEILDKGRDVTLEIGGTWKRDVGIAEF